METEEEEEEEESRAGGKRICGTMARGKNRMRFSKLYTFGGIFKPSNMERAQVPASLGGLGFSRLVFCNQTDMHKVKPYKYRSNYVSTTKYNVITFFPKALFEQFRRVANLYFLLAAALSLTSVSPYSAVSLILPLVFVVGVSMCKEALEDWRRFLQVCIYIFFLLKNFSERDPSC